MSTLPAHSVAAEPDPLEPALPAAGTRRAVAWSSLVFAILQSVCTALVTINGIRLLIGLGALAMTAGAGSMLGHFHHIEWLRYTLLTGAVGGALVNLGVLWQVRRLRNRPAARWRQRPLDARKLRGERLQLLLATATLVLVCVEEYFHFQLCHHL
jgi:hypothetical protein